ncbi:MAG: polysaccharide deacetylase family protein [Dechloromonas sp.]|uniref:Polysaccharide deacetylase family protein n=1 Tax=Candidatus Dechloromonas phosphorivorans TaxID=2899244 RepID=A0A9D7LTU3_9RHOO|nr:polysaccharide deacetylase family protein [Candidatus Dechloromonas phosphorivorans]
MIVRTLCSAISPAGIRARLSVLIFHRVLAAPDPLLAGDPCISRFDEMMGWIKQWFNVLPLDEAVARLGTGSLPARAAAITFDDGYADNLLHAVPVLKRHGLHATFFIATGFLDGGIMWNDRIIEAVRHARTDAIAADRLSLGTVGMATSPEKCAALDRLIPAIKHLPPDKRLDMVESVVEACGAELPRNLMLTSNQLIELRNSGMAIGAHTVSHPILALLSHDQALCEISESRDKLESLLGQPVPLFAYPNGKYGTDYNDEHVRMLRSLGFSAALTTTPGAARETTDPWQLPRFTPWDRTRLGFGLRLVDNFRRYGPAAQTAAQPHQAR